MTRISFQANAEDFVASKYGLSYKNRNDRDVIETVGFAIYDLLLSEGTLDTDESLSEAERVSDYFYNQAVGVA